MDRPEKKTEILHIRVETSVADALRELAAADDRKLSPYVARVLRRHVEVESPKPRRKQP